MDFSGRTPPFVDLGDDRERRRRPIEGDVSSSSIGEYLGPRLHGFTMVARIERGRGVISGSFGRIAIGAGDIVFVSPGSIAHAFEGRCTVQSVALRTRARSGAVVRATDVPSDLFERPADAIVAAVCDAPARVTFHRGEIECTLVSALIAIAREPAKARLPKVAHDLGYSADGLRTLMRRTTGRGFAQWRDALLMARVRTALASPGLIGRIARDLNVEPSYLHRRFVRAHGITPARWRDGLVLPPDAIAHQWDALAQFLDERTLRNTRISANPSVLHRAN